MFEQQHWETQCVKTYFYEDTLIQYDTATRNTDTLVVSLENLQIDSLDTSLELCRALIGISFKDIKCFINLLKDLHIVFLHFLPPSPISLQITSIAYSLNFVFSFFKIIHQVQLVLLVTPLGIWSSTGAYQIY